MYLDFDYWMVDNFICIVEMSYEKSRIPGEPLTAIPGGPVAQCCISYFMLDWGRFSRADQISLIRSLDPKQILPKISKSFPPK